MQIEQNNRRLLFPKLGKFAIIFFAFALIGSGYWAFTIMGYIFDENVKKAGGIYVTEKSTVESVQKQLVKKGIINEFKAFKWVAKKKKYNDAIKPGYYFFKKGLNTNQIVNKLRSGDQNAIKLTFNNVRFKEDLAGKLAKQIQADSTSLLNALTNSQWMDDFGFRKETYSAMFVPNTYQVYWTIKPEKLIARMHEEYNRFWTESRKRKAEALGMSPVEVSVLASIVQEETVKADEKKKVAGVYVNRLKKGMLLQADPTVKFALGDFSIKRILNKHLKLESPYNTYKYKGLPPGPINYPEISSIDAVLNYEQHRYLYFCAKEDFSGYHNFAKTLRAHNKNARKYQRALNKNKIFK
ncbi:endolytic transglycosylase MltG [Prolixibacteraceae bacterium JC049]|nr:endolytic transglycosylase MltG [Prolixibacteraceae bacterium JC049]